MIKFMVVTTTMVVFTMMRMVAPELESFFNPVLESDKIDKSEKSDKSDLYWRVTRRTPARDANREAPSLALLPLLKLPPGHWSP